ncbi:MAG: VTT domain-containing protein [Candidatus Moranbacteria bacterium]|nr:VTT domain-containing protein [Candidatus Moranbacteria bacterium]
MEFFGIDLVALIKAIGYVGVFGIVFAETGLFLGFFFPGDSLLFVAGFLASQGFFSLSLLLLGIFLSGVAGNLFGYEFGRRVGPKIFSREDSWLFKKAHVLKAQAFYERHGAKTIVLARFMPIVRTFAPIVAGVANMRFRTFLIFNLAGAFLWTLSLVLLGYILGSVIDVDRYLLPIILAIVMLSFLPAIVGYVKEKYGKRAV